MAKHPKGTNELIDLMRSRNLKIYDTAFASNMLKNVPYYNLVNAYKDMFVKKSLYKSNKIILITNVKDFCKKINKTDDLYLTFLLLTDPPNILYIDDDYQNYRFEDLYGLYDFDKSLSNLLFKYILHIENTFTNALANTLVEDLGYLEHDYLDRNKYNEGHYKRKKEKYEIDVTIEGIEYYVNQSRDYPEKHYREKWNNVPPWISINKLSIFEKRYLYKLLNLKSSRVKVALYHMPLYRHKGMTLTKRQDHTLDTFFYSMSLVCYYRNEIAHNKRVYNFNPVKKLRRPGKFRYCYYVNTDAYTIDEFDDKLGDRNVFGLFMSIVILIGLRKTLRKKFVSELEDAFNDLRERNPKLYKLYLKNNNIPDNFVYRLEKLVAHYD